MDITVKYTEYAGEMERAPETVKGSYNEMEKTISIRINDEDVEYLQMVAKNDDELMAMGREAYGEAFTKEAAIENRKAVLDYFRGRYAWSEKATAAIAKHV